MWIQIKEKYINLYKLNKIDKCRYCTTATEQRFCNVQEL